MSFQALATASQKYFPELQIKYKDQCWPMLLICKLLFFLPSFKRHTTTIGDTIYFPSQKFVKLHPVTSYVVLLHELVHLHDQRRVGKLAFITSYLFPQVLVPICLLLMFIVSWKIMLPLALLCTLPIPAVFRMHWEKRAYLSSFYVLQLLGNRLHFDPHLKMQEDVFLKHLHGFSYYAPWPFHDINKQFDAALDKAKSGKRPFQDQVFDMLEDLSNKL
jgi:hypothetical protein